VNRKLLALVAAVVALGAAGLWAQAQRSATASAVSVDVFKSATCGCCAKWVDHMKAAGFTVHVTDLQEPELQSIKDRYGVQPNMRSCHTARVNGFTVEGHVPASEVKRLLNEKPDVVGITVPGMPLGSPGMEVSGVTPQPYKVYSFDKSGASRVYSTQKP